METAVQISDGRNMSVGFKLPAEALKEMTVVGSICMDVALIMNSRLQAKKLFSFCSLLIALTA